MDEDHKKKTPPKKAAPKKVAARKKTVTKVEEVKHEIVHAVTVEVPPIPVEETPPPTHEEPVVSAVTVEHHEVVTEHKEETIETPLPEEFNPIPVGTNKDIFNQTAHSKAAILAVIFFICAIGWYFSNKIAISRAKKHVAPFVTVDSTKKEHTLTPEEIQVIVKQLAQEKFDSLQKANRKEQHEEPTPEPPIKHTQPKKEIYEKAIDYSNIDTSTKYMQILLSEYERLSKQQ